MNLSRAKANAAYRKPENDIRIEQRVCLECGYWMRSTSPAHRICNHCKGEQERHTMRVGDRIRPVEGHTITECWTWETGQFQGGDL